MLQLDQVGVSFGHRVLFDDLSLSIMPGEKVGLVGVNGSGKSSLLKVIMGELEPDHGTITKRQGLRIGYLSQTHLFPEGTRVIDACFSPHDPTAKLVGEWNIALASHDEEAQQRLLPDMDRLDAWQYEREAETILHSLQITDATRPVSQLSGGELKRVALAGILLQSPDLLILDEPTNHLDLSVIEWLESYLIRSRLTLLLITHDRYFLDHICTRILELDLGHLYSYEGNYETFLSKREERLEQMEQLTDRLRNIYRQELVWMRSTPQARGGKQRARKDNFTELTSQINSNQQVLRTQTSVQPLNSNIRLGGQIIELHDVSKSFTPEKPLFHSLDYLFARRDKVGIIGPNGCGKTTLLKVMMGELQPDTGSVVIGQTVQIGYFGQKAPDYAPDKRVIDIVSDIADHITDPSSGQSISASQLLKRFLFDGDRIYTPVSLLSGGEVRRLYLCTVLMHNPNLLILDEPTNDLDVTTLGVLEEYLHNFDGVLIIVTHDRYFLDKLVDHLFVFEPDGTIRDFPGNFTQYRTQHQIEIAEQQQQDSSVPSEKETPKVKPIAQGSTRKKKRTYKEEQEYRKLDTEIPEIESQIAALEQKMSSGTLTTEALLQAGDRISALQTRLEEATDRWLTLAGIEE